MGNAEQPTLLIVEDDPDIATALATYARHKGYRALTVGDGAQAVAVAESERPEVILLDISLPGMDGRDVMMRLKKGRAARDAVVIFVTARDSQDDRLLGLELGAADYETKPLVFSSLFRKIEALRRKKT